MDALRNISQMESVSAQPDTTTSLDPRVLSSVMISVKLDSMQEGEKTISDPHARLLELMYSPPMIALLDAANLLASKNNIAPLSALKEIISGLKEIDDLWTKVLLKEGLNHLSSQYH